MEFYPSWKSSLFVFGSLIALIMGNFFWQVQKTNKSFREHSLEQSKVLGAVVELNIKNSLMSRAGMETIVGNYLKNSADFIAYLDKFEPFSQRELTAFASESGLAGIKIFRNGKNDQVTGPKGWLAKISCGNKNKLQFLPEDHLYIYTLPYSQGSFQYRQGCIIVGMSSKKTEKIQKTISVDTLLKVLNHMDGIEYVRFEKAETNKDKTHYKTTKLIYINKKPVSETRITMGDKELIVGLKADYFSRRMQTLKKELVIFISFLVFFGILSSWWLYRIQQHRLEQTRQFEREMARQLEQASLGRAALTITHEMRNPLNAISIGLQRLQMEAASLEDDHCNLIISMREAVKRSNSVITNLQQYARSFELIRSEIIVADLIESLVILYQPQCLENGIELKLQLDDTIKVIGDENYLSQAFENIIKNATEAQPEGGFIKITLSKTKDKHVILFENPCASLDLNDAGMTIEPYFTTKTYGTGLGLAISKKIIEAHSGHLEIGLKNEIFSVYVSFLSDHKDDKGRSKNENINCG